MEITNINTYRVVPGGDSWVWVEVQTDKGVVGWGEASESKNDEMLAEAISAISRELIGLDPRNILGSTASFYNWAFPDVTTDRIITTAWSAVDQALWDISAKVLSVPLYHLLGGYGKSKIRLYANLNRGLRNLGRDPASFAGQARAAVEAGFSIAKCTPFDEVNPVSLDGDIKPGLERIEAVEQVLPISQIAIDCHQRLRRPMLAELLEWITQKGNAYWIEDPATPDNSAELRGLQQRFSQTRWVSGEAITRFSDWWDLLDAREYDVLMPDVKHVGGVSQLRTLIPMIEQRGVFVSMHNPTSPIGTAFSAHLTTLARNPLPLEFPFGAVQERSSCTIPAEPVVGDTYVLSERPGIGLAPSKSFLHEYGMKWNAGEWHR